MAFSSQIAIANEVTVKELNADQTNSSEFLEPDQAFKLDISSEDSQTLKANFVIAPGHYLYRQRINFKLNEADKDVALITETSFPKGEMKQDPNFGKSEVYHQALSVLVKLQYLKPHPEKLDVIASFQGCSEKGLCYSPIEKTLSVAIPAESAPIKDKSTSAPSSANDQVDSDEDANTLLKGGNLWLIILGFFGFGLLLSLTPCVFPMIPILSGIIVGQGQQTSKSHSFYLSVAYTLGMAFSYTLAGIAAGLSGQLISAALQNPWVLGTSAFVFVLLALSMFGFYELQLPSSMESSVLNFTNRIKGGKFISVFIMGVLSALIVSPCVAAPLAGALLYIGQTHDVVLGGAALFALSLGMGVPLLIVGASAGALLPKAGGWMVAVRNLFGVLMLGMAIWLISPVIPPVVQMLLWAALLIVSSIYLHALDALPSTKNNWSMFWKGIGVILLLYGVSLFLGALSGGQNPLQPLSGLHSVATTNDTSTSLEFKRVKNTKDLEKAIEDARGKYVMLDFYADWCAACKEYERLTFRDAKVASHLKNVVLLQADVTKNSAEDVTLLKQFKLFGPPAISFFDKNGNENASSRIVGYKDATDFISNLNKTIPDIEGL